MGSLKKRNDAIEGGDDFVSLLHRKGAPGTKISLNVHHKKRRLAIDCEGFLCHNLNSTTPFDFGQWVRPNPFTYPLLAKGGAIVIL